MPYFYTTISLIGLSSLIIDQKELISEFARSGGAMRQGSQERSDSAGGCLVERLGRPGINVNRDPWD